MLGKGAIWSYTSIRQPKSRTVQEIVERHSTLETANIDLAEIQTESETQIEETAASFLGSCQGCCDSSADSIEVVYVV